MIKLVLTGHDNRKSLVIGLTAENVDRLRRGEQAKIIGDDVDIPDLDIYIMYGHDIADITEQLRSTGLAIPDVPEPSPGRRFRWEAGGEVIGEEDPEVRRPGHPELN